MQISQLYIYPVKSLAGIAVNATDMNLSGLSHDRQWMVVQPDGKFITQRSHPQLALIETRIDGNNLTLSTFSMEDHVVSQTIPDSGTRIKVEVWKDVVNALAHDDVTNEWLSQAIGTSCILVSFPEDEVRQCRQDFSSDGDHTLFADVFPLLMISQGSLDDLNRQLDNPVGMDRFRPNIVVDGCEPYAEDSWKTVGVNGINLRIASPCSRCSVPTIDQQTGMISGPEPIHTLSGYRQDDDGKIYFGVNLIPKNIGKISIGDEVLILE